MLRESELSAITRVDKQRTCMMSVRTNISPHLFLITLSLVMIVFLVITVDSQSAKSKDVSGIIYFEDGSNQWFYDIKNWHFKETSSKRFPEKIQVYYQNSERSLSFSDLRSVTIENFKFSCPNFSQPCIDGTIKIETVTGISLSTMVNSLGGIVVVIMDELTGEIKNQWYSFARNHNGKNQLVIRKIEFDQN